jgi:hypothetical protein
MADATDQDRAQLSERASSRRTRTSAFSPRAPTKWHPTSLLHPATGEPFTEDNCWSFVAEAIDAGAPIEVIELKRPAGKRGFVLKLAGHEGVTIYVKLQLLSEAVLGRSFHESRAAGNEDDDDD